MSKSTILPCCLIAVSLLLFSPVASRAAVDMFLKIEGVKGESQDSSHTDWIEILSYSHGVSQPSGGITSGGARTAGRADHEDFTLTKYIDKSTPILNLYCCNGRHIPKVELELAHVIGPKAVFYKVTLKDVMIVGVDVAGHKEDSPAFPIETVRMSYGEIQWQYTPSDEGTGGTTGSTVSTGWSVVLDKEM